MNRYFLYSGYIGTVFLCLSFVPQVYSVFKTKDVEAISYGFLVLQLITCMFLGAYGIGFILADDHNGLPILAANVWITVCVLLLFLGKHKFTKKF